MKLIIIPTLNEKKNIKKLFFQIHKLKLKSDILFIDDNSTDGTREEIINFNKKLLLSMSKYNEKYLILELYL